LGLLPPLRPKLKPTTPRTTTSRINTSDKFCCSTSDQLDPLIVVCEVVACAAFAVITRVAVAVFTFPAAVARMVSVQAPALAEEVDRSRLRVDR
jgi:hypothetical protein